MMKTTCPRCGVGARGKFCSECGARLDGGCTGCGAPLSPNVQFCPRCGVPAIASSSAIARSTPQRPYAAFAVAAGGLLVATAVFLAVRDTPLPTANPAASTAQASNVAGSNIPDISNMSPRERAARLYDRVMQYEEQGRKDSVAFFAPMALGAYESLPEFDLDARYDYGRIAVAAGDFKLASAQADTILQVAPAHLLGLSLAARTAEAEGKSTEAGRYWQSFRDARVRELARKLPEYGAHSSDIDAATRDAERARAQQ